MNAREQFSVIAGVLSVAAGMILTDLWGLTTLLSAIPALILLP
jgi:hypothetical protein